MKAVGVPLLFAAALSLAVPRVALGNGGGYTFGVKFTGSIAPFQASGTEHIHILREDLSVDLRRTDAAVVVRYKMRNLTDQVVTAKFGFPVEAKYANDFEDFENGTAQTEGDSPEATRAHLVRAIRQLKNYAVSADGASVPAKFVVEPFASGKIKAFPGSEALRGIAGWMVSEVVFAPSSMVAIEIHYTADHDGDDQFVSDDDQVSPLAFRYRLSTGSVWNGPIESGTITIRTDGIPASEVEVVEPRERFRRSDNAWVWEFRNLKPTLADDITVNAVPGYFLTFRPDDPSGGTSPPSSYPYYLHRLEKWAGGHQRFEAAASSVLPPQSGHGFGAANVSNLDPVAPWCEGVSGPGIGEYLEVMPRTPKQMMAIGLFPGFQDNKRPALFVLNARPARVEILLNDQVKFLASIGDKDGEQLIPIEGFTKPVSKLRITLKDVYSGTHYEDTCITRLILYDLLPKDPGVGHAR